YEDAVGVLGSERLAKFISNPVKAATLMRETRFQDMYMRSDYAIRQGALWLGIIIVAMGLHPSILFLWFFPIAMFVAAVMGLYITNERINRKDLLGNAKQMLQAFFWGLLDVINFSNANFSLLFRIERNISHRQIGLISELGKVYAPALAAKKQSLPQTLTAFNQYFSHYRRFYGTASIVLMAQYASLLQERALDFVGMQARAREALEAAKLSGNEEEVEAKQKELNALLKTQADFDLIENFLAYSQVPSAEVSKLKGRISNVLAYLSILLNSEVITVG
ncbi:MAG: hypothetical protein NTY47_01790, partial [Candidatus Omnitrophica bacterium]|nr:hypothetical protein [Candidatus Omnitrophota bacterium]